MKNNTFENYKYIYETFVRRQIGSKRVSTFLKSDIKRFYNYLVDERELKPATVDGVHNILHQIFDMAVDDNYIRNNPTNNVLRELKKAHCFKTEKRRGLTRPEQELFMDYLKNSNTAVYWYPVFAVMLGTGLRVGEATGLRWCDIDLEDGIIDVNHTLVYYDHRTSEGKKGCYFNVNTPKTEAGNRQVPMLDFVKEAFVMEKQRQELLGVHCEATIDGYTDFIFLNRFGQPQHQSTLNKAIRRIIRDCNDEQFLKTENPEVLLPHFSCHSLRHTFTTRMCEAGVNIKVIQDTLGHKDITTTLNIYTDVTKELKRTEFDGLDKYLLPRTMVGVGFTWNIFDGLNREKTIRQAKIASQSLRLGKEKAITDLEVGIDKFYSQLQNALDNVKALDTTIEMSRELVRVRKKSFQEGMATSTEVVDAEVMLAKVKTAFLLAYYQYDVALINLLSVCGTPEQFHQYKMEGKTEELLGN